MPSGLQAFGSDGALALSLTDRIAKLVGSVNVSGNGSIILPSLQNNTVFYYFVPSTYSYQLTDVFPAFTVSGLTLSWVYTPGYFGYGREITGTLYYGLY